MRKLDLGSDILDEQGNHAGFLEIDLKDDVAMSTEVTKIEVVAVCKGWTRYASKTTQEVVDYTEEPSSQVLPGRVHCYFVLWIKWESGVAKRQASGRVYAAIWDKYKEKEPVELILG